MPQRTSQVHFYLSTAPPVSFLIGSFVCFVCRTKCTAIYHETVCQSCLSRPTAAHQRRTRTKKCQEYLNWRSARARFISTVIPRVSHSTCRRPCASGVCRAKSAEIHMLCVSKLSLVAYLQGAQHHNHLSCRSARPRRIPKNIATCEYVTSILLRGDGK